MIFLTRIEAVGFKSYATDTTINFTDNFIGIVGPNGSGKTNAIDAIRWVLGESSAKQLRGDVNTDIIFYGSEFYKPSEVASVSLYFNNKNHSLKTDNEKVVVKRILKKNTENSEYYLNDKLVRRKDILDLFLDTGLSKGSLGIISQGTVQSFVDAKPEERRKIFEEAAGIGKYIKSKNEHITQLQNVELDLDKLLASANQYENSIKKLQSQANIAQKYINVKNELEKYELLDAKRKYLHYSKEIENLNNLLSKIKNESITIEEEQNKNKNLITIATNEKNSQEEILKKLNDENIKVLEKLSELINKKTLYESSLKTKLSSNDRNTKINALKENVSNLQIQIDSLQKKEEEYKTEIDNIKIIKDKNKNDINFIVKNINSYQNKLSDLFVSKQIKEQIINNEYRNEKGLKALLDNKDAIPGIIAPLNKLIKKISSEYVLAIDLALGKNIHTLIVNSVNDARLGINFLKQNNAGTASFIPLNGIKAYDISNSTLAIAKNFNGFINTADKLVEIDSIYYDAIKMLIGNILIVDNLQNANLLAKAINYSNRIITLDGDVINRGGMIVGGSVKKISSLNIKEDLENTIKEIDLIKKKLDDKNQEFQKLKIIDDNNNDKHNILLINLNSTQDKINDLIQEIKSSKNELFSLGEDKNENLVFESNKLTSEITQIQSKKNELYNKIKIQQQAYEKSKNNYDELNKKILETNDLIISYVNKKSNLETKINLSNVIIEKCISTANFYKLTIDTVISKIDEIQISDVTLMQNIQSLKSEIESFGVVNMQAINDLEETQSKLNELNKNIKEIQESQQNLKDIISSLDKEVSKIFKNKILEINKNLPSVFGKLFRNAECELQFTEPNNLLETGIEVIIKHNDKKIRKLNVLSGGEKAIISLSILLTVLKISKFPLVILDEAESALDPINAESLAKLINENKNSTQFIVVTHRKETMVECDKLLGATQVNGITSMFEVNVKDIKENNDGFVR